MEGQGRPKRRWNSDLYPKVVTVRVTETEHQKLLARAERYRLSASRYLATRGLAVRLPTLRDRPKPTAQERADYEYLLYELRKIGVNLNQLAHQANVAVLYGRHKAPKPTELLRTIAAINGLVRLVRKRL